MKPKKITQDLCEFISGLNLDKIPTSVVDRASLLIADSIGVAVRARSEAESTPSLIESIARMGLNHGEGSVFSDSGKYSYPAAALINGTLIHSLDFDDTHIEATVHPSAPVVAAAIAAGQMTAATGSDVLIGVIAGYEIMCRLGKALNPVDHYDRGFHPTATTGSFGATVAASRILGLTKNQIEMALGICLSQVSGSMQFLENSAWTKRFQVGNAAMTGVIASNLAASGFVGAAHAIEGKSGFLSSYSPNPNLDLATQELNESWETMQIGVKPYPSCRFSHAALDGIIDIVGGGIAESEIVDIEIGLSRKGMDLTALPQDFRRKPMGVVGGQFSMHFTAAVAAETGNLEWDDYEKYLNNEKILELAQRVNVIQDEEIDSIYPKRMGGKVTIRFKNGTSESRCIHIPKGEPENFPSENVQMAKFISLVTPVIGNRAEKLYSELNLFSKLDSVDVIFEKLGSI